MNWGRIWEPPSQPPHRLGMLFALSWSSQSFAARSDFAVTKPLVPVCVGLAVEGSGVALRASCRAVKAERSLVLLWCQPPVMGSCELPPVGFASSVFPSWALQ